MSAIKIKNKLHNLSNALDRLNEVCQQQPDAKNIVVDATIQRFEFSFELFWKTLKILLLEEGVEADSPKNVLIRAYEFKWINDEKLWLDMMRDRNNTSHVYDEKEALRIYNNIKGYYPVMREAFNFLNAHFEKKLK